MDCNRAMITISEEGKGMNSKHPCSLHCVCGKTLLEHVIGQIRAAGIEEIALGTESGKREPFYKLAEEYGLKWIESEQELEADGGNILFLKGDTPLLTAEDIEGILKFHGEYANDISVLDAGDDSNDRMNTGMFCIRAKLVKDGLVKAFEDYDVTRYPAKHRSSAFRIRTGMDLAFAEKLMRRRINRAHMIAGVTFINPKVAYIDADVVIGRDTVIYPGVILTGKTVIGEDCLIGQNSRIEDAVLSDHIEVQSSVILKSTIGRDTKVGPFAFIRPGSEIGEDCKIGDFVEVKNANIGNRTKASHLTYIGDADVGENVNLGCGVIFANYDGVHKNRTTVKDNAFIGSNSNLVAPVVVEEDGYVAAGTTVTSEVPKGALCVGRAKQKHIEGWVARKGLLRK